MTYYTGIDVSLRSVSICVVDDKGEVCLEAKMAAEIGRTRRTTCMTQKLIAKMLGVEDGEVTSTARALQATGAIGYRDGRIRLLNRQTLEEASCECYEAVRKECRRLLPQPEVYRIEEAVTSATA